MRYVQNSHTTRISIVLFAGAILFLGNTVFVRAAWPEPPQPDGRYITDWLVAAPLDSGASFDSLLGFAAGANAKPSEGDPVPGHEIRWTRHSEEGNFINLREITGFAKTARVMALCEFESDMDQSGRMYCATQNNVKLWINGIQVFEKPESAYGPLRWVEYEAKLRRGSNSCLVMCSTAGAESYGFALRIDGPKATTATPLVWNPIIPGVCSVDDGRYVLHSPDWRWMEGDDPAWAKSDFDDSNWKIPAWPPKDPTPEPGGTYWMRVRGHFAPGSTLVPYSFSAIDVQDMEVYLDGVRIHGRSMLDSVLDPFQYRDTTVKLPHECALAVRVVSAGPWHPVARLAVRRADKAMSEELRVLQPREHHRLFLVFLLACSVVYYLLVYRNHPRQIEGTVCIVTVALAVLSMLLSTTDSWTFNHKLALLPWMSPVLAGIAYLAGIAMIHVMAYGAVSGRAVLAVLGYGAVSVAVFASGWKLDNRWIAFSIFPLILLEYLRVWIMYDLIPRRANRGYVGIGLFFFVAALIFTSLYSVSNGQYFHNAGPYAHLYGLVGLAACLVMYTSREAALGMHKLQGLTATLESKVAERTRQVSQLTEQLITAEEVERERLARELHDSVAQTLWYAKMAAESKDTQMPEMLGLLDKAIGEVRTIAYGLRPPELDKLGFVQAISQLCKDFSYNTGISLDYQAHGVDNVSLSPVAEVNLYRVLQEALNNIQQHSGASNVRVRLVGAYPNVMLRVEDDGRGFDMDQQGMEKEGRMGLSSMEERIRLIGGAMRIKTAPGEGVRIVVEVPQHKEQA